MAPPRDPLHFAKENLRNGTANMFAKAIAAAASDGIEPVVRQMGKALEISALPRETMRKTNQQIARQAATRVAAGWRSRLPLNSHSYRPEDRLTGKLGNALNDIDGMISETTDRVIAFADAEILDREAAHWYRINYGAAGPNYSGGATAQTFTVTMNGRPMFTLRDENQPATQSWLPRRFTWAGPEMVVLAGPASPRGQGSRAAHFLDIGYQVVAEKTGNAYQRVTNAYLRDQIKKASAGVKTNARIDASVKFTRVGWTATASGRGRG